MKYLFMKKRLLALCIVPLLAASPLSAEGVKKENTQEILLDSKKELDELRHEIDEIHGDLFDLIRKRFEIVKRIAKIKQDNNLPIYDPLREEVLFENIKKLAEKKGLDPQLAKILLRTILVFSKKEMQEVIKD
ncbi:hypothetical protein COB11_02370 [Candidatus Aerophobetes bacterium]|uniref:Chorismate mutase domain-containing protein n=1 Tax=Aerophobetes bacterium TaxID=2030807 RepID=A0A2A4YL90_UNCAE|nr:MAG: hypothetical protein COB11_02370 [Candidatus Aerophobetes bacterium]